MTRPHLEIELEHDFGPEGFCTICGEDALEIAGVIPHMQVGSKGAP
jgi:hypothetical protein